MNAASGVTVTGSPSASNTGDGYVSISYDPVIDACSVPASITSPATVYLPWMAAGSVRLTSTGNPVPTLSETGNLPYGLTFTASKGTGTATISGTAGLFSLGQHQITLTATNGVGHPATQTLDVIVGVAPRFLTPTSATFTTGRTAAFVVGTVGFPAATITESGTLPLGVGFRDDGNGIATLTGAPQAGTQGSYPVTLTATNGLGASTQNLDLTVVQPHQGRGDHHHHNAWHW